MTFSLRTLLLIMMFSTIGVVLLFRAYFAHVAPAYRQLALMQRATELDFGYAAGLPHPPPWIVQKIIGKPFGVIQELQRNERGNPKIEDLALLAELPELERIDLSGKWVDDRAVDYLQAVPKLRSLHLENVCLSSEAYARLAACANLRVLQLSKCDLSPEDADAIGKIHQLEWLGIRGQQVGDTELNCLHSLPRLQRLIVEGMELTDAGFEEVGELPELKDLDVDGREIGDGCVHFVLRQRSLQTLRLYSPNATEEAIMQLSTLPRLTRIEIGPNVTPELAQKLADAKPGCSVWVAGKTYSAQ